MDVRRVRTKIPRPKARAEKMGFKPIGGRTMRGRMEI